MCLELKVHGVRVLVSFELRTLNRPEKEQDFLVSMCTLRLQSQALAL